MKNKYEIRGDVTVIFLKSTKHGDMEATINTRRLERVKEFPNTWYAHHLNGIGVYVHGNLPAINGKRKTTSLHRWIMDIPDGLVVDHINGEKLDNRDINLRAITAGANSQNLGSMRKNNKSGVRGVVWNKRLRKWVAQFGVDKKTRHVGVFDSIEDADKAVKEERRKHMPYSQEALA